MVFGAHCYVLDPSFDTHFFKEGFVGVSFFFILSGFIIAYNYEEKLLEKITTKRTFWVARIARIYPLHLLTLLIAACIGGYVQYNDTTDWIKHFAASTFLLQPSPLPIIFSLSTVLHGAWGANSYFISVSPSSFLS